ncbi:MAG: O-methyltransferase [Fimbriimonadaceae bacterium]
MRKSLVPEVVEAYIDQNLVHPTEAERALHEETMKLENSGMCSSHEVGGVLAFLVRLIGARQILEIGVFTGYTALKMASALPENGQLVALDINEEWPSIGKPHWHQAGVAEKIDLRIGPALETLKELESGRFDMAFIDADKAAYPHYYEACLKLIRPGGLLVFDNMLRDGRVADSDHADEEVQLIRALNDQICRDPRVDAVLLTVGDGLLLAQVR